MRRKLEVAGWIVFAIFYLMGVIGAFPLDSSKLIGLAIWSAALVAWLIVGWRSVRAHRKP